MKLFNRKNSLRKRLESLEDELGLLYRVDAWGDGAHFQQKNGYGTLDQLQKQIDGTLESLQAHLEQLIEKRRK